jgi:hypothetical protein
MMKYLLGLLPIFVGCTGSLQDRIDQNRRLCGPSVHGMPAPLFKKNGERYTATDRKQLSLRTLKGSEREEGLTENACLDVPEGEEFLLVDGKERSFRVVSARLALSEDLRLFTWTAPNFQWDCPAEGRRLRRGVNIPMTITDSFQLKGQSLAMTIQALDREWNRTDIFVEPALGLTPNSLYTAEWDNGDYLVTPVLTNPFGEKNPLAPGCRMSMFTGTPRLDVSLDSEGLVSMNGDERLPVQVDAEVNASYCLAVQDGDCQSPGDFRPLSDWQLPAAGGRFQLYLQAEDAYGNRLQRTPLPLILDRSPPEIKVSWTRKQRNRLGHVDRLPFAYYEARVELKDDISSAATLATNLQCRVRMQMDAVTVVAGSFAICDTARCQDQRFEDWTPCSPDIAFRLDETVWKKFPASREIILEVRTADTWKKTASDSAMVMVDPDLYPQFTADQWKGQMLNGIEDMTMTGADQYWLIRKTADDDSKPREILSGSFGKWTAVDYPAGWEPMKLRYSDTRYFALLQPLPQRNRLVLWEWLPAENRWQQPMGTESLDMTEAAAIVDRLDSRALWIAGQKADEALIRISADGQRQTFACPVWGNGNKREQPKILIQFETQLTLLSQDRYYTFDSKTERCELTAFPEYQGPALVLRRRTLFRDQKDRVWTTGKNQIDVLENGVWRHLDIAHQRLHPKSGVTAGAYQFDDGSYVILRSGDLTFIPDMASRETVVFNKFNTRIINGPAPNNFGENYEGWDPTVFYDEGDALLSVKGGVLTRTVMKPNQFYIPRQWGGGTTHLFRMEQGVLHLGMVWAGLTRLSEKGLERRDETNGLPFNTVTSVLFDQGRLASLIGVSQWESSDWMRKVDITEAGYKKDLAFDSMKIRGANAQLRAAQRDAKGRLWFSMVDTGDFTKPGGNFFIQDQKLVQVQPCTLRVDDADGLSCAEQFIPLPNGDMVWRDNRKVEDGMSAVYDLYAWNESNGLRTLTGPDQTLPKIYDATGHAGELWVTGLDQEQRGVIGVYRNNQWETELLLGDGAIHCARLGFNRNGELYCIGRYFGVLVKRAGRWELYETPKWNSPGSGLSFETNSFINGHRRYVYFEDGLLWVSRRSGVLELYEVEPALGWGRWWQKLP